MHSFKEIAALVEQFLKENHIFPDQFEGLYGPCRYLLQAGGKRVRPALCLMAYELFKPIDKEAMIVASSLELFHNFTLIHDDIMDKAPLRRGVPTVHVKYGTTAGILSGDIMCIYAYIQLGKLSPELQKKVYPLFNKMAIEVCEGQQMDTDFEHQDCISSERYLKMIELKTAVLLAASLQTGGVIAGAEEKQIECLYQCGYALGMAFQLQDDYLDVFGTPQLTGKQPGGDILEDKKTILYIRYLEKMEAETGKQFKTLYSGPSENKVEQVLHCFREAGIDRLVEQEVAKYSQKAFEFLGALNFPKEKTTELTKLFDKLLYRTS